MQQAGDPATPAHVLAQLATRSTVLALVVAGNPSAPQEVLEHLVVGELFGECVGVSAVVARNPSAEGTLHALMVQRGDLEVLLALSERADLTVELVRALMVSAHAPVRRAAHQRGDSEEAVRGWVAQNVPTLVLVERWEGTRALEVLLALSREWHGTLGELLDVADGLDQE